MQNKWSKVKLGEVLTERIEKPNPYEVLSGEIPIIAKIGFDTGEIQLREESETKTDMILIRPGDLVISGINAAKGAIAVYKEENAKPAAATIHYSSYIINKERADPLYLWYFLRSKPFKNILINNLPKGIKTEVKANRLLPIVIPLPLLGEQKKIASRIDTLVAEVDKIKRIRNQVVKETEAFFLSALESIFGKNNSKKWSHKRLLKDGLGSVIAGQHILKSEYNTYGDGFPYITGPADFGPKVPEIKRWTHNPKSTALPGDILLTVKGAGVGKINLAPSFEVAIGRQLMAIRPNLANIIREYLYYYLRHRFRHFQSIATATTVPGFRKTDVEELIIPLPDKAKQHNIVAYLNSLESKVDEMRKLHDGIEEETEEFIPSILDKAFKGEL